MFREIEDVSLGGVRVLAPANWHGNWDEFLRLGRSRTVAPFEHDRIMLLDELAQRILRHPWLRRDAGCAALGFWLRRAHLFDLHEQFKLGARFQALRVPAGLVLHFAPANVDTMFVLSWALSFLTGNSNVVRLTTRSSDVMGELLSCLGEVLAVLPAAGESNLFITYEHNDTITTKLSLACDARVIWGGDETVRRIRSIPLNPHATERAFATKRSLSVFDAAAYLAVVEADRDQAAARMAADLTPFAQLACSSPHVLHWLGTPVASKAAAMDFGKRLEVAMAGRKPAPDFGGATRRISHAFAAAGEGRAVQVDHNPYTTLVRVGSAVAAEGREICGMGLLIEVVGTSVEEVGASLRADHQTITYFGLDLMDRTRLADIAGQAGVDRIVPIGRALDFGPQWDGFDLWSDLTRLVVVG